MKWFTKAKDASPLRSPSLSKRTFRVHIGEGRTRQKTTLRFASVKKPSPSRRRVSGWNNKLHIFSSSLAHFPLAYKYVNH